MQKIVYILFCLLLVLFSGCVKDDEPRSLVGVGDTLPHFEVTMNDGCTVSDLTLRGREAWIVFFNTGCADCRRELPRLEAVHRSRPELTIVCIARSEDAASVAAFWRENDLTLPYSPQPDASVYHLFATSGIPRLYVADASGRITAVYSEKGFPELS